MVGPVVWVGEGNAELEQYVGCANVTTTVAVGRLMSRLAVLSSSCAEVNSPYMYINESA